MKSLISVSVIIPTANRSIVLEATLTSLSKQELQPEEIIIIDASADLETLHLCQNGIEHLLSTIIYRKALQKGAAVQRNQAMEIATRDFILFCDDDILFEPFCIDELWKCINSNEQIGGVNAIITNQQYTSPGMVTSLMYKFMSGTKMTSYAGKCFGPAWNLLPEDNDKLPKIQSVDWLNLGCTLYRKSALPLPPFPSVFKGYSMMEDLTLSLSVGKKWKLYNVRTARIFHDSQPGDHKKSLYKLSKMEIKNRHFVMTKIMINNSFNDYFKLLILELFFVLASLQNRSGFLKLHLIIGGKIAGLYSILKGA